MELKELKNYGYQEKYEYDTQVETLEDGRRVTTETPINSYFMKIYNFENGWIKWKVCVENSETEGVWNVRLTLSTRDGYEDWEFESPNDVEGLLALLGEKTEQVSQITEL